MEHQMEHFEMGLLQSKILDIVASIFMGLFFKQGLQVTVSEADLLFLKCWALWVT